MSLIPEQFSAASKAQIEAQLDFFQTFGTRACETTARLVALNLDTGRAAVDTSAAALKQLAGVREPRDLLSLTRSPTQNLDRMINYGREWFNIMADVQAGLFKPVAGKTAAALPAPAAIQPQAAPAPVTPPAPAPAPAPAPVAEFKPEPAVASAPAPAPAVETAAAPAPAAAEPQPAEAEPAATEEARSVKPSKKPVVAVKPEPAAEPVAEAKPIAKAAGKLVGSTPAATAPAAVLPESPEVNPHLKPSISLPPPVTFQQDLLTPRRGSKKR